MLLVENLPNGKWRASSSYGVNVVATDGLATQGARASVGIDVILPEYSGFSTRRVNTKSQSDVISLKSGSIWYWWSTNTIFWHDNIFGIFVVTAEGNHEITQSIKHQQWTSVTFQSKQLHNKKDIQSNSHELMFRVCEYHSTAHSNFLHLHIQKAAN